VSRRQGKHIGYLSGAVALGLLVLVLNLAVPRVTLGARPTKAEGAEAEKVIETLDNTLLMVMKDAKRLGYRGRYEILKPVVEETFDFESITRYSVGRLWKTFDEKEKEELVQRFTTLSIATYAARFDGYGGEKFRLASSKPLRRGRYLVRTELVKADGEIIHMDYVMKKKGGKWRAVNVVVNGVSDLSLKRAQYTYILRKKNYEGLIRKLDKKIAAYEED